MESNNSKVNQTELSGRQGEYKQRSGTWTLLKDGDTDLRFTSIQAGMEWRWMKLPRTQVWNKTVHVHYLQSACAQ